MKAPMMKPSLTAMMLCLSAAYATAEPAGLQQTVYDLPHHGASTRVAIWYPSTGAESVSEFGSNPVFKGVEAALDADIQDGPHPVVLFSHGMGGTDRAQAWLGSSLAQRGAIVVMVNHPNSTWGNFDMSKGADHWTRVADLSVALDTLAADPFFAGHIDAQRIMAAGFSFGGWTALSMGGLTGNHEGFVAACADNIDEMEACDVFLSDAVNVQSKDPEQWNAEYRDDRVTHVVALDPGFVWGLEAANTATLDAQTVLIGLGSASERMMATDFDESGLAGLLSDATVHRIAPAFHFTAMPLCTDNAVAILEDEQDDPVCTDPNGTDRAQVHAQIIDIIASELGL